MNAIIKALALSLAVATPAISFAQSTNGPMTRAQVRNEIVQLDQAGYRENKSQYPADIQSAEARVAARNNVASSATTDNGAGYGGAADAMSQSGHRLANGGSNALYDHH
ncbi:MAG: DUF4148 domain-containing protein [Paraburkholderia sp.]|jgi:hypothetical protein|nr:DUF4148 domain-containing protein [Paraburkholderia sp.]